MTNSELETKIMSKVIIDDTTGCWLWQGGMNATTPQFNTVGHRTINVRRLLYQIHVGSPKGKLQPACGQPRCVNPAHVTQKTTNAERCQRYRKRKYKQVIRPEAKELRQTSLARLRELAWACGYYLVKHDDGVYRVCRIQI